MTVSLSANPAWSVPIATIISAGDCDVRVDQARDVGDQLSRDCLLRNSAREHDEHVRSATSRVDDRRVVQNSGDEAGLVCDLCPLRQAGWNLAIEFLSKRGHRASLRNLPRDAARSVSMASINVARSRAVVVLFRPALNALPSSTPRSTRMFFAPERAARFRWRARLRRAR